MPARTTLEVAPKVRKAFTSFLSEKSQFALPLQFSEDVLSALQPISYPEEAVTTLQTSLSQLEALVDDKTPLYLLLRNNDSLTAITYIPYRAKSSLKQQHLEHRYNLIRTLGPGNFDTMLICKEPGEIVDERSWKERAGEGASWGQQEDEEKDVGEMIDGVEDYGYRMNRCRLCDRRTKYPVEVRAFEALKGLSESGRCVQLSVDIPTETLILNSSSSFTTPGDIASSLPTDHPSLTLYRHAESGLYFIFCSPDSATVKERMMHTLAIPGLINIILKEIDIHVDQKIEIHDPEDLDFQEHDERIGRFRSMFFLNGSKGTESHWKGMPVS